MSKYYEVKVIGTKMVCVQADNEQDAEDLAADRFMGDWNDVETEVNDEFDSTKDLEHIKEYKQSGEFLSSRPATKPDRFEQ